MQISSAAPLNQEFTHDISGFPKQAALEAKNQDLQDKHLELEAKHKALQDKHTALEAKYNMR